MLKHAAVAFLVLLLLPVSGLAHPVFTNEPAGMTAVSGGEYTGASVNQGCWIQYSDGAIVSDGTTGQHSPPAALRSVRPANGEGGSKLECSIYNNGFPTEVFWGGFVRPSRPFSGHEGNKFITWFGNSGQIWGMFYKNNWQDPLDTGVVWGVYNPQGTGDNKHITQGVRRCDATPGVGTCHFQSGVFVNFSKYTKIEIYQRQSTCNTCRDGILRMWIDGQPTLINYENYNTPATGGASVIQQSHAWGCDSTDCSFYTPYVNAGNPTDKWWYDHMYVSTGTRVGGGSGGGGGGGDTTPPPVPSNVQVIIGN